MKPPRTPHHVVLIPDGNRRWARERNLPTFEGHRRGFERVSDLTKKMREFEVDIFTVWAFSTENWNRQKQEVDYLMKLYQEWIDKNLEQAKKDKTRIVHLGRKDRIPISLKRKLIEAEQETKTFVDSYFAVALDYGGRDEILRAVSAVDGKNITENKFLQYLDTKELPYPEPDLIIRTSGEKRTSGFMIWQAAYSEYIFVDKHLPDFTVADFEKCLEEFRSRKRRFGK